MNNTPAPTCALVGVTARWSELIRTWRAVPHKMVMFSLDITPAPMEMPTTKLFELGGDR